MSIKKHTPTKKQIQISISLFKGVCFLIATIVLTIVGSNELQSIFKIKENAENIAKTQVPEFIENQKTLVNIERLRYIAEVIRRSDDPKERRSMRISAEGFASESIFDKDPNFKNSAKNVAVAMKALVTAKNTVDSINQNILELKAEYKDSLIIIANTTASTKHNTFIMQLLDQRDQVFSSANNINNIKNDTIETLQTITNIGNEASTQHPDQALEIATQIDLIKNIFDQNLLLQQKNIDEVHNINQTWKYIDNTLHNMRDNVTVGAEESISNSMLSIKVASNNAFYSSISLYIIITILFFIYYLLVYYLIIKPLRLTSEKLSAIQAGKLDTELPKIYITELANIGTLLNRFSTHLSELYSHANQLEEDVNKKRNFEAIMQAVFRVSLDGYIVWNENKIFTVSEGAVKLFELKTEENFIQYWEASKFLTNKAKTIFKNIHNNTVWRENIILYTPNHTQLPCEFTHLMLNFNDSPCILSYIRDLREQKKNESALLKAKEEAEVAAKAKSDFLARMSHEIRTPMNGVIGLTKLALESSPSPRQQNLLEKIQSSANILLGVINDILDFSKIEQGLLSLEIRSFTLSEVITPVFDLIEPLAFKKNIKLNQKIDSTLLTETKLMGDNFRLSQILLNLCGNAIKFTEKGNVTLSITTENLTLNAITIKFSVADTGIGMTPEQQKSIFQPFAQADSSTTRKYGGTGLGLMISKLLIEQMGGDIKIKSEANKGSEFYFSITFQRDITLPNDKAIEQTTEQTDLHLAGKRILVVEDNEINQEILVSFLDDFDLEVTTANNGQEALNVLKTDNFDCIFMDIQMPVMDGLTATREIRKNGRPEIKNIPIIAMTAHVLREDTEKSIDAGMNNHMTKPIEYEKLTKLLKDIFA